MGRIKTLTHEEVAYLRENILATFKARNPALILPPLNAYLPNYSEIQHDMQFVVPEASSSVSQNRLRKLFYYGGEVGDEQTNGQLNLGVDFIDACYLYISSHQHDRESFLRNGKQRAPRRAQSSKVWLFAGAIVIIVAIVVANQMRPGDDQGSRALIETFEDADIQRLKTKGWHVLSPNTAYLGKQLKEGFFTFHTLPGSYWTKPEEPEIIENVLYHAIPNDIVGVRAGFDLFNPEQKWQSLGLVIYDENRDAQDVVMLSYGHTLPGDSQPPAHTAFAGYHLTAGVPNAPFSSCYAYPEHSDGNKIRLEIRWDGVKIDFYCGMNALGGMNQSWEMMRHIGSCPQSFAPRYVGAYACQGWTDDERRPVGAKVEPVFLDWVEMF